MILARRIQLPARLVVVVRLVLGALCLVSQSAGAPARGAQTNVTSQNDTMPATNEPKDPELEESMRNYREGCDLVSPYFILNDSRRPYVTNATDRSKIMRGIALLEGVVLRYPGHWAAWWVIGKAYHSIEEHQGAFNAFDRAVAIRPDHPDVAREYVASALHLGKCGEAVRVSDDICKRHPENAGLRANHAYSLLICGQQDEALKQCKLALTLDPADSMTKHLLGRIEDIIAGRKPRPTKMDEY